MTCPSCGGQNDDAAQFCIQCGKSLLPTVRGGGSSSGVKTFATGKNPTVALVLSLVIPGAGQFYNGDPKKGGAILGAYLLGCVLLSVVIGIFIMIAVWIWGMIDAYNVASGKSPIW
jgi:TM2 domain-containing membrane protein YozV